MVNNIDLLMLTRENLEKRLKWYEKKYGPYVTKRGMHNIKNLFRKPNLYEWVIFIMLMLALFMGWAYQRDFVVYKENIENNCCEICGILTRGETQTDNPYILNFTLKEENSSKEVST